MDKNRARILKSGLNYLVKSAYGKTYEPQIRRAWSMSTTESCEHQSNSFRNIYDFARSTIPYYRDRPMEYPALDGVANVSDILPELPILAKSAVKQDNDAFWPVPLRRFTTFHSTSGTSGTPIRIAATLGERAFSDAIAFDWWKRVSGNSSPRVLMLTGLLAPSEGSGVHYVKDRLSGRLFLSIYSLREEYRDDFVSVVKSFDPHIIYGYASAIRQLSRFAGDKLKSGMHRRVAITTSEVLHQHWEDEIRQNLTKNVFNQYGSQEGAHLALECENGCLHIHPLVGIVEIVDKDGDPVNVGASGEVLVTSLLRKSFPLVRYRIGDVATSTGYFSGCPCGIAWPTIGQVQGRSEDLVRTRDGREVGMLGYSVFKDVDGLKEAQIVQTGYERFTINLVLGPNQGADRASLEGQIRSELSRRMQHEVCVEFCYLDAVPRTANGKFRAVMVQMTDDTHSGTVG